jgi:hypothetical protein
MMMLKNGIALLLSIASLSFAEEVQMEGFSTEPMVAGSDRIHLFSAFEQVTYLTTYSYAGEALWEMPFNSQVLSWKIKENQLLVFSKARSGFIYFLSCIDERDGALVWERAIFAPSES